MRVATWNINGLRARLAYLLDWLADRQPDLVGLQELKMTDEAFPAQAFEELGYRVLTHGQKAWNGVAILSRRPVEATCIGLPGQEAMGARLLGATAGPLSFTTVYVPNGKDLAHEDFARKLHWLDDLARYLEGLISRQPLAIVCGDLNLCPGPLDSWGGEAFDGRIFHTGEERVRFQRLRALGLMDVYRENFPEGREFSWWDYRAGSFPRGRGLRIDFLLATPGVHAGLSSVFIDREYRKKRNDLTASDHAPVVAEFAVGES
uniref:Exodeoxyribonuclease III n=1 Tax=Candidatus Kentrum sp. DK TaxID=2126562 RepID=A0A450RYB9_9GAMM|nr:MAG: Exodeoxyribonuclease III [Candidatus Kentron sp. DK]